jgi:hypothetical protein
MMPESCEAFAAFTTGGPSFKCTTVIGPVHMGVPIAAAPADPPAEIGYTTLR